MVKCINYKTATIVFNGNERTKKMQLLHRKLKIRDKRPSANIFHTFLRYTQIIQNNNYIESNTYL